MEDKQEQTLEKYSFEVKNRYRARGAVLLDTDQGPKLLREYEKIQGHFIFATAVKEMLAGKGMDMTDRVVYNRDGDPVTEWESGEKYVVYEWYYGDSCDYRSGEGLFQAAKNLGRLHQCMENEAKEAEVLEENLLQRYERHNREMKRVYTYMKEKKRKSEFELNALSCFSEFFDQARRAGERLERSAFFEEKGKKTQDLCHGEYNYHNLIVTREGIATTNFERAACGVQLMDLAYFLRKVMEKNGWQVEKGRAVLEGYRKYRKLDRDACELLMIALSYPVKYWKLMNQYMNGKKSWISDKNRQKLIGVREQEAAKSFFLKEMAGNEKIDWS